MTEEELAAERKLAHEKAQTAAAEVQASAASTSPSSPALITLFWLFVGIPLA